MERNQPTLQPAATDRLNRPLKRGDEVILSTGQAGIVSGVDRRGVVSVVVCLKVDSADVLLIEPPAPQPSAH